MGLWVKYEALLICIQCRVPHIRIVDLCLCMPMQKILESKWDLLIAAFEPCDALCDYLL